MANIIINAGSGKNILIWENADPQATFPAQTLTLQTGFTQFLVVWLTSYNSANAERKDYINFSTDYQSLVGADCCRLITNAQDGSITFANATSAAGGVNSKITPYKIYGVKQKV